MTEEQIYKKIEEIYNSEKGKGFITHLVRSFFPVSRTNYMMSKNDKKSMFCSITKAPLITKDDVLKIYLDNSEELFKNFADRIKGNDTENILGKLYKGKLLAIECEHSTKLLSPTTYRQLYNFITTEMLNGNKHINFVISDELKKMQVKSTEPSNQNKKVEPEKKVVHRSTTKLGDMDALAKLKQKLEEEGK